MSVESIYKDLKAKLLSIRKDLVLNPGSVINDVFLAPQSYLINKNRTLLLYVAALQTFEDILALKKDEEFLKEIAEVENKTTTQILEDISDFIDKIAANYNVKRNESVVASGYVYFGRFDMPNFDIEIPEGTEVSTLDNKFYKTTESAIMYYENGGDYYDNDENLYLIKVPVKALENGVAGNTASYTVNTLVNQVSGINYVLNKDNISNGYDRETDENLISRLKTKLSGINNATENGLKNLILSNFPTIKDIVIINTNDELMTRDGNCGGKVDVYILEESEPTKIINEQYNEFNEYYCGNPAFYLKKEPVFLDGSFEELIGIPSSDYVFVKGSGSSLDNSKFEKSLVAITNVSQTLPFYAKYKYYKICEDIQNFLNLPENKIIGSIDGSEFPNDITILIKKAIQHNLNLKFTLYAAAGYDTNIVKLNVRTVIANFVNATLLASKISQSDIIGIAEEVEGVDYLDFTNGIFDLDDGEDLKTTITVLKTEYIRLGTLNIL
jgi:hypothetical protein